MGSPHSFSNVPPLPDTITTIAELIDKLNATIRDINNKFGDLYEFQIGSGTPLSGALVPTSSGLVNDLSLGRGSVFYASSVNALAITGMGAGVEGRIAILINQGTKTWTIAHESGSSQAQNRFHTRTGNAVTIAGGAGMVFSYDGVLLRWLPVSTVT